MNQMVARSIMKKLRERDLIYLEGVFDFNKKYPFVLLDNQRLAEFLHPFVEMDGFKIINCIKMQYMPGIPNIFTLRPRSIIKFCLALHASVVLREEEKLLHKKDLAVLKSVNKKVKLEVTGVQTFRKSSGREFFVLSAKSPDILLLGENMYIERSPEKFSVHISVFER